MGASTLLKSRLSIALAIAGAPMEDMMVVLPVQLSVKTLTQCMEDGQAMAPCGLSFWLRINAP
ncbi:hypothetical protein PGTUg99_030142 [Puccinia graminis f. sp. tritici]|uniref:Uncharacterized protein n=1 Tax=Puccinia graminis f. sp. tritici TaxID=56615 RepID=A0A5B0N2D4_PUCGR|nr:hypothetical protein PGTUg99_030142 [Puccinia graminis f. sp. tritici]